MGEEYIQIFEDASGDYHAIRFKDKDYANTRAKSFAKERDFKITKHKGLHPTNARQLCRIHNKGNEVCNEIEIKTTSDFSIDCIARVKKELEKQNKTLRDHIQT